MTPILAILLLLAPVVRSTITLSSTGKQLHSRPAEFGLNFEYGLQYVSLLQYVPDDMHLCHGVQDINDHDDNSNAGKGGNNKKIIPVPSNGGSNNNSTDSNNNNKDDKIHVTPSNGVPVALLAKRGQCSYETKARVASTLTSPHGVVRFVIVYNDKMEDGERLITMMPKDGHDEARIDLYADLGLVFVSYESGMALHEYLNTQPVYINKQGGPQILIDGTDGWFPPYDESAASFAFLLMLFGCVCSFSVFLSNSQTFRGRFPGGNNSDAVNEHHLFLLGGNHQHQATRRTEEGTSRRRGNGLRLLTLEEVETLPTIEYTSCSSESDVLSSGDDRHSGCSSSRGLELRDKTDLPYVDGDDMDVNAEGLGTPHNYLPPPRDEEDEVEQVREGGLCQGLSSPKKKDPYFRHQLCSICLDEYEIGEQIRILPCQHTFHSECIFPWLTERSPTCPLCKAMFEAVHVEEEEQQQQQQQQEEQQQGQEGGNDNGNEEQESDSSPLPIEEEEDPIQRRLRQRRSRRSSQRGGATEQEETNSNNNTDVEESLGHTSGFWRYLFGSSPSSSGYDAAANAINNERSTLEDPLLPDV